MRDTDLAAIRARADAASRRDSSVVDRIESQADVPALLALVDAQADQWAAVMRDADYWRELVGEWQERCSQARAGRNAQAARIDKALAIPDWGFDPDDKESIRDARLINATLGLVRRALTEDTP